MGSSEERNLENGNEDGTYASLTRESVKAFAKSIGYPKLTNEIAALLIRDINYKLTETMHCAGQFMKHSGREKLTTSDVNRALFWCDVPQTYGYTSTRPLEYVYDSQKKLLSIEENEVDLIELATTVNEYEVADMPTLSVDWLAIEGIDMPKYILTSSPLMEKMFPPLSKDQINYYKQMSKAILGNNEILFKIAVKDLRRNDKISPLLPYFLNCTYYGMKSDHDVSQKRNLLLIMDALIRNPCLFLLHKQCLDKLAKTLFLCIDRVFMESKALDHRHFQLQECAGSLFAKVLKECASAATELYLDCLNYLKGIIRNRELLTKSHFGAVNTIIACGAGVIYRVLYPQMASYITYLNEVLADVSFQNARKREIAQRLFFLMLTAAEILLRSFIEPHEVETPSCGVDNSYDSIVIGNCKPSTSNLGQSPKNCGISVLELYEEFYSYFGPSLNMHLPCVSVESVQFSDCTVPLFSQPEDSRSGVEMLEDITAVNGSRNAYGSSSLLNSTNEAYNYNTNIMVKNIVSDQHQGTKMTLKIIKKPVGGNRPTRNDQSPNHSRSRKKKKLSKEREVRKRQMIDKDSSSNSEDTSLMENTKYLLSKAKMVKQSMSFKSKFCRKLATGNLNIFI